jgi:hypothetical protein
MSSNASVRLGRAAFALGAPQSQRIVASVTDIRNRPWEGVTVSFQSPSGVVSAITDVNGIARIDYPGQLGEVILMATTPDGVQLSTLLQSGQANGQVTAFRFNIDMPISILTPTEAVALAGGILLAAFGFYHDHTVGNIAKAVGMSAAVSSVASSVKRHL